jgi:phage gp36-like protein
MYLSINDLKKGMRGEVLDTITRCDESVALQAIAEAQAEVESYLSARYDVRAELQKDADSPDRLPMVVKLVREVALNNVYNFTAPVNIPENRIKSYDGTVTFLRDCQAEKVSIAGLQRLNAAGGGTSSSYILYGGEPPRYDRI